MTKIDEQETTITLSRADNKVYLWTSNLPHLIRLRTKLAGLVTEVAGGEDWGSFEIPVENFKLFSAIRRKRVMSDEQRQAVADRFAKSRKQRD